MADASRPVRRRLSGGCRDAGELSLLDGFDAIILDDIGYVQQSRAEMEVLFTLLAERYERRSVIITSNLGLRSVSAR